MPRAMIIGEFPEIYDTVKHALTSAELSMGRYYLYSNDMMPFLTSDVAVYSKQGNELFIHLGEWSSLKGRLPRIVKNFKKGREYLLSGKTLQDVIDSCQTFSFKQLKIDEPANEIDEITIYLHYHDALRERLFPRESKLSLVFYPLHPNHVREACKNNQGIVRFCYVDKCMASTELQFYATLDDMARTDLAIVGEPYRKRDVK